jgi:hypothetical protein
LVASHVDLEAIVNTVEQHIEQLSPPAEAAGGGGKGGKKKGKKPKAYKPRLSLQNVLQRISHLLHGQPLDNTAIRRIVGDSGALNLVLQQIFAQEGDVVSHQVSTWVLSLKFVQSLLVIKINSDDAGETDEELSSKVPQILERLFGIWTNSKQGERIRAPILQFLSAVISTSRDASSGGGKKFDAVPTLIKLGWLQALVNRICSYPADVGGMDLLIQPILFFVLAGTAGRGAVIDAFKSMFESDEALDLERTSGWGVVCAVKRILDDVEKQGLDKDVAAADLDWLVEAGVVEYAVKLLRDDDMKVRRLKLCRFFDASDLSFSFLKIPA